MRNMFEQGEFQKRLTFKYKTAIREGNFIFYFANVRVILWVWVDCKLGHI